MDIARLIERAATEHKTLKLIAAEIGTDTEILRRWMRNDPTLAWAYDAGEEGRARTRDADAARCTRR